MKYLRRDLCLLLGFEKEAVEADANLISDSEIVRAVERLAKRVTGLEEEIKEIQRMTESLQGRANEPLSRLASIGLKTRRLLEKDKPCDS